MNSFIWKNPANAGGGGGNITQLEQQVQNLQTQLQQLQTQIQNLTQQLTNVAKKNERNKFTNLQEIQYPNEALSFIQDNNANYIHFKRSDGTRRGYVGIGSGNSNVMDVAGAEGVKISSTTGDIRLSPENGLSSVFVIGDIKTNNNVLSPNSVLTPEKLYNTSDASYSVFTSFQSPGGSRTRTGTLRKPMMITSFMVRDTIRGEFIPISGIIMKYFIEDFTIIIDWHTNATSSYDVFINYVAI